MRQKFKSFFKMSKIKGKKRKRIMSGGLAWKLVFGQAAYIFNSKSPVVQEKVILNQEEESKTSNYDYHSNKQQNKDKKKKKKRKHLAMGLI